ncbi:hypothetical protein [Hafnia alvei]|uniref:hypothetical protein n=1 Tax=Hafnia alvei TaxID=569 RepID=UPI00345EADE2
MGRARKPKTFIDIHNKTPWGFYWDKLWSTYYEEHPSTLGKYAYSRYSGLEPLEQLYIGRLKVAFDTWLGVLYGSPPPSEPTMLQKMFLDKDMSALLRIDKDILYNFFFEFIYAREIEREDIVDELNILLVDDAVPYSNFFEVSCYFYIIATRHFSNDNADLNETQFFRAMFEAINALNTFECKHDTYLQEKIKESHTNASRKGGENKYANIRAEVIRLLISKIKSDQPWELFKSKIELTKNLHQKVEEYILFSDINLPNDLFDTLNVWSLAPKSDIALLYRLLVEESTTNK